MRKALADNLMSMCAKHSEQMAEQWYQALSSNSRTASHRMLPKPVCLRHAVSVYGNLGQMYFADNCYQTVGRILDVASFAEDHYARGVPLEEVLYALILMRRQIWLYAEFQALYNAPEDMYELVQSINRTLLVFDYAAHITAQKYRDMTERGKYERLPRKGK